MKNPKNTVKYGLFVVVFLALAFLANIQKADAAFTCARSTMTESEFFVAKSQGLIKAHFEISNNSASAGIRNYTNCNVPVSFVSYKVYDQVLAHQVAFDAVVDMIPPNDAISLNVRVPSDCMTQVDVYFGRGGMSIPANTGSIIVNGRVSGQVPGSDSFSGVTGLFCGHKPPEPPEPPKPALTGACSVNPGSVNVGGYLNWDATASGGNGSYTYSWSGTDGLSGNASFISKAYFSAGTKTGAVTITSGNQSITRNCSAVVNEVPNNLSVSCRANPSVVEVDESVNWSASVSGGNGSYTYSWSGTDGLSGNGQYVTHDYDSDGTKTGTVTVTSGGQTLSASCTVRVEEEEEERDDLRVSCYASPSSAQTGNRINWYARVSGGDGDYDYDWSGTDGLNSSSRSPSKTYNTPGSKRAEVTVTDGDGQEDSATCYANVNSVLAFSAAYQSPIAPAVYLDQVPYTGVADNIKLYSFLGILALLSAWIAYIIVARKSQFEA